ncbi:glycosyltransferase family 9 protein [Hydrogenivirga sp. 128-5-R1-1]|uniref:glycosyltransferase family 9 protein n=1 Tax=Hydrogenivirga sp. 128-5-R1-1 TaxID=392423 RepID=UPI00015EF71C|nr:glycosyltransferase family 9 protein [Hydrogenivirga sp. 128-5-R1-1]EDP75628.1 diaminopimelate epimerase [Hydrogenivirga sp. 128-5-R1-1]
MKRALLYRKGGLGDTLLTFPLLEILKRKGFHTTAVGNTDYFAIARHVGWTDRVLSEKPKEEFDLVIDISLSGNVAPFPEERRWVLEHYLELTGLRGEVFSKVLPLEPLDTSSLKGRVVLHPSSGSSKKNPDISLFRKVEEHLSEMGLEVVYLVGEADRWVKEEVNNYVESYEPLWIARALKGARLFVGLDSGLSHLSAYVGVPTVVIYGPSDPIVWKPVGERVYQLSLGLECSPCFPNVCDTRECLEERSLLERLLPLLDELLIKVNEDYTL